jgi:hypothetical protein
MSRPKIAANQVNANGSTAGQVLTSTGTDAAWTTQGAKIDGIPNAISTTDPRTFVSNGDTNGVFYFLGTGLGQNVWANPATSSQIVAVRSSNWSSSTVNQVFDRSATSTSSGNVANSWIFVDLGVNRSLIPNRYSLRHYSEGDWEKIRNWKLQGTNSVAGTSNAQIEAATWTDLDVRSNDTTINGIAAWGDFVPNQSNTTAFRYLRLIQTGLNSSGANFLAITEWEVYGTFTYLPGPLVDGRLVVLNGTSGLELRQTAIAVEGGQLSADTNIEIRSTAANGSVTLTPSGTGTTNLGGSVTIPSLTANRVILSNGTGALQTVAPGTSGNVLQSNGTTWISAAAAGVDFQTFTSSGTWTKPTNAKTVEVICIGGGGGGGRGRRGAAGTLRRGGGGGGGGALSRMVFAASLLGGTETVTVGAGGNAGAAQTTDSTNGNAGGAGGNTTFGNWVFAGGGGAGAGGIEGTGTVTAGNGGSVARLGTYTSDTAVAGQGAIEGATATCAEYGGGSGGRSRDSDGNALAAGSSILGGPGGGGGGNVSTTNNGLRGGDGGNTASYTTGGGGAGLSGIVDGANGDAPSRSLCGTGGGGGDGVTGAAGGLGGAGGRGAGGGGGGGSPNGNASGAGGAGGAGIVYVIAYL